MSKCIICSTEITTTNDSDEHIIPNAIGGKLKIKGFLCRKCNSKTGDKWDVKLSEQLNLFSLLLGGVKRDRGVTPSEVFTTISGKEINLANDGIMSIAKPLYTTETTEGTTTFKYSGSNINQVRHFIHKLCQKHPSLNKQNLINSIEITKNYLGQDALTFNPEFGGEESGRSLVKTILAFATKSGIDPFSCNKAIEYLLKNGEPNFGYYYSDDVILKRNFVKPAHCIAVHADPVSGLVIGYLEYFSVWRVISLLSDCYKGREIKKSYYIYPEDSTSGEMDFNLPIDKGVIISSYNYEKYDNNIFLNTLSFFLKYCREKSIARESSNVITEAWDGVLNEMNLEEGDQLSEEQCLEFSEKITQKISPFLINQWKSRR
ncbi:TPA: HNH endonuclease [Providencia alcalifaciens]